MIQQRIEQFKSGEFTLTGQWDAPAEKLMAEKLPGVIFCHGFTGNRLESRRMYSILSRRLVSAGIATLRFDHRGCGDSEGDFKVFTKDGLLEDLDAALRVFQNNRQLDLERTAVVGYSLGGLSANYLLSRRPDFVTAVLWAAVAQPDIIRDRLAGYPDYANYMTRGFFDYGGTRVSAGYIDQIGLLSPVDWAKNFKKPVFFIQGGEDSIVKPNQVQLYLDGRQNPQDRLLMIEYGDHAFGSADNVDKVVTESEKWLVQYLKA